MQGFLRKVVSLRILFLGDSQSKLSDRVTGLSGLVSLETYRTEKKLKPEPVNSSFDLVISYGYRHIIKPDVLASFRCPLVNLHISMLPFNRGSHPNIWSWAEGTPPGVSIHLIDSGLDTGPVIDQKTVQIDPKENTFETSYELLHSEIRSMFTERLDDIISGNAHHGVQIGDGSRHRIQDLGFVLPFLQFGWQTNIFDFQLRFDVFKQMNDIPLQGCFHK